MSGGFMAVLLVMSLTFAAHAASPGEALFTDKGCSGCHSIGGQGGDVGPALDGVAARYKPRWIYKWLKDPAAVKPGTIMPDLDLTDDERARLVFYLMSLHQGGAIFSQPTERIASSEQTPDRNPDDPQNDYLATGVAESYLSQQRFSLQDQIQSFIPPIYQPAFTQAAFVLPPGAMRTAVAYRDVGRINASDVAGQRRIGARFVDFNLKRSFLDFDFFLGLDHNMTMRVNVPVVFSTVAQQINPAFNPMITAFPTGQSNEVGDITLFLKKKFIDQGNFPVGIAGVAAIRLPTGSDSEMFDGRTTVSTPAGESIIGLPAINQATGMPIMGTGDGTFRRFTDSGELPAPLQPGLGRLGGNLGLFASRIFDGAGWLGRGAIHAGGLYQFRPRHNGVDPGNQLTLFTSLVKPVYRDQLSVDLSYVFKNQDRDHYDGLFAVPTGQRPPAPPIMIVGRPSFSGGSTQLVGASLIANPNPLLSISLGVIKRLSKPALGPSPDRIFRLSFQYTFASDLF